MSPSLTTRTAACWLIALILFPFSAPLSVCDLGDLAPKTTAGSRAPLSNSPIRSSVVKDAFAQAFPVRASRSLTRRHALSDGGTSVTAVAATTRPSTSLSATSIVRLSRPITKIVLRI
ncbi:MAG TPA: hypothetical protein VF456_29235 [Vicinamibacterales bacterium]